ncbi:MAG: carboxypeptidase-like regulatory domain-containing protein [Planctomycetota bacterium]|jgi:hypothetical protein
MRKSALLVGLSAICLLGGCTIHRICRPFGGTVIDATTGAPIKGAEVRIRYWQSERVTHTDSQGRYAFGAKYKAFPLFPLNLNRVVGCHGLRIEAAGYQPADVLGPWAPVHQGKPPPEFVTPKVTNTDKGTVADPIPLTRIRGQ